MTTSGDLPRRPDEVETIPPAPTPPPSDAGRIQPGSRRIGRYVVMRELGEGGMGTVFLAHDPELARDVALKVVLPDAGADALARIRREAQAAARLDHPNVVKVLTVDHDPSGRLVIALEVVSGGSLADRLQAEGPLPPAEAAALVAEAARAIDYAHQRGVLHRDIKPANVLLAEDGTPKVGDFGLAKQRHDPDGLTKSGVIMGSPGFMSPEQAAGEHDRVDQRADVYGLGATLFTLLTNRRPFEGSTAEVIRSVLLKPPPSVRSLNPAVDPSLDAICLEALAPEPADRIATAAELADALDDYLAGGRRTSRAPWAIAAAGLLAVLIGGGLWALGSGTSSPTSKPSTATPTEAPAPTPTPSAPATETVLTLDAETLAGPALPSLETWGPWSIRPEGGGITIRANGQSSPELSLPLRYAGGPFHLELTGAIRLLEVWNRLEVALHPWPDADGPLAPALLARLEGVPAQDGATSVDARWRGALEPGTPVAKRPRVERDPDAPFRLRLSFTPPDRARLRITSAAGRTWYEGETRLAKPLPTGPYRLRLGNNLRDRRGWAAIAVGTSAAQGRAAYPSYRFDVRNLRLRLDAPAGTFTLPGPTGGPTAGLGRLLRAAWSPRATTRASARATLAATGDGLARSHARYTLAWLQVQDGELEAAAETLRALHQPDRETPPVATWFHKRWSRDLHLAPPEFLVALQDAYPSWGLSGGLAPQARAKALMVRGKLSLTEVLLSGARLSPTAQRRWRTREAVEARTPYLSLYRAAETLVLLHRPRNVGSLQAVSWLQVGGLEQAERVGRRLLELGPDAKVTRNVHRWLGNITFRLARWKACVDHLERARPLRPPEPLFLREARRRSAEAQ